MVATKRVSIPKDSSKSQTSNIVRHQRVLPNTPFLTEGKIPVSKAGQSTKHAVSPTSSPQSMSEEVLVLRARNKLLTQALAAIHSSSEKELKKRYDLVWFAKYRCKSSLQFASNDDIPVPRKLTTPFAFTDRHPNHEASERIDKEYQEDIEKLRGEDGDFHHGFNSGVLAAARMAKSIAEVAKADDFEVSSHAWRY